MRIIFIDTEGNMIGLGAKTFKRKPRKLKKALKKVGRYEPPTTEITQGFPVSMLYND